MDESEEGEHESEKDDDENETDEGSDANEDEESEEEDDNEKTEEQHEATKGSKPAAPTIGLKKPPATTISPFAYGWDPENEVAYRCRSNGTEKTTTVTFEEYADDKDGASGMVAIFEDS